MGEDEKKYCEESDWKGLSDKMAKVNIDKVEQSIIGTPSLSGEYNRYEDKDAVVKASRHDESSWWRGNAWNNSGIYDQAKLKSSGVMSSDPFAVHKFKDRTLEEQKSYVDKCIAEDQVRPQIDHPSIESDADIAKVVHKWMETCDAEKAAEINDVVVHDESVESILIYYVEVGQLPTRQAEDRIKEVRQSVKRDLRLPKHCQMLFIPTQTETRATHLTNKLRNGTPNLLTKVMQPLNPNLKKDFQVIYHLV